jgi:hypothetical protein
MQPYYCCIRLTDYPEGHPGKDPLCMGAPFKCEIMTENEKTHLQNLKNQATIQIMDEMTRWARERPGWIMKPLSLHSVTRNPIDPYPRHKAIQTLERCLKVAHYRLN